MYSMKSATKNYFLVAIAVSVFLGASISFAQDTSITQSVQPTVPVSITAEDVASAGFVSPQVQPPTVDGNYQPASYFWVNGQNAVTALGGSSVQNLVMVSVVPTSPGYKTLFDYSASYTSSSTPFAIDGGIGQEFAGLSQGRTVINFIKNDDYVVIIGHDTSKVEALASIVASKIN